MVELVTLEQHMDTELPTVVIQGTDWWGAVLEFVKLQEGGLGVHLSVKVCCYYLLTNSNHIPVKKSSIGRTNVWLICKCRSQAFTTVSLAINVVKTCQVQ